MFCPQCRVEYREGFTQCSDCGVPLVAELRPEPEPPPDVHLVTVDVHLVTVFETLNPVVLAWAKSALEHARLHYLVKGEAFRGLYGGAPMPDALLKGGPRNRA